MSQSKSKLLADRLQSLRNKKNKKKSTDAEVSRAAREGPLPNTQESILHYWRERLDGVCRLALPAAVAAPSDSVSPVESRASRQVTERLKELGEREGVSLLVVLLSAFKVLLSRYSGQTDVAVMHPMSGRTRPETERPVGRPINPVVLRTDLSGNPTFAEVLRRVASTLEGARSHQDLLFDKLIAAVPAIRENCKVEFVLHEPPAQGDISLPDLAVSEDKPLETNVGDYDLTIDVSEAHGQTTWRILHSPEQLDKGTAERFRSHFGVLLESIAEDADRRLSDLQILTKPELHQLLVEWDTAASARRYVLGRHLELLPVGVEGELCIADEGQPRPPLDRPDLAAKLFVPDPYAAESGARMYRTRDLARRLPDGEIEVLGRIHGVKVRGYRSPPAPRRLDLQAASGEELVAAAIDHYNEILVEHHALDTIEHLHTTTELYDLRNDGGPLTNVLRPFMIDRQTYRQACHAATEVGHAIKRAVEALLADKSLRSEIGIPDYLESVLDLDRGHSELSPVARLDGLLDKAGNLKFIEYNQGPGSLTSLFEVDRMFDRMPLTSAFRRRFPFSTFPIYDRALEAWRQHHLERGRTGTPTFGLVVDDRHLHGHDFRRRWLPYLSSRGLNVLVGNVEDFDFRQQRLFVGKDEIDIVLADFVDYDGLVTGSEHVAHIAEAVRQGAVAAWPNFSRDKLAGYKTVFEILSNPVYHGLFPRETVKPLGNHIPWSRVVRDCKTTYRDGEIDLLPFLEDHRECLVLKPGSQFGGADVVLGWRCDSDQWRTALERATRQPTVVQERIDVPQGEYPVFSNGEISFRQLSSDFNLHLWNTTAGGLYVRVAPGDLTNVHAGARVTGTWILENQHGCEQTP